jgi:hypothetical protein
MWEIKSSRLILNLQYIFFYLTFIKLSLDIATWNIFAELQCQKAVKQTGGKVSLNLILNIKIESSQYNDHVIKFHKAGR